MTFYEIELASGSYDSYHEQTVAITTCAERANTLRGKIEALITLHDLAENPLAKWAAIKAFQADLTALLASLGIPELHVNDSELSVSVQERPGF